MALKIPQKYLSQVFTVYFLACKCLTYAKGNQAISILLIMTLISKVFICKYLNKPKKIKYFALIKAIFR